MRESSRLLERILKSLSPKLLLAVVVATAGCGDGRFTVQPVSGRVLVRGEPAPGAVVIFYPQSDDPERQKLRPHAETDSEGEFQATTYLQGDGAPAGDYRVAVVWNGWAQAPQSPGAPEDDESKTSRVVDRLGGRYKDPDASGLEVTIARGKNELPAFELE